MREIHFGRPCIDDAEKNAVMDVLNGPILVHGPRAKDFEKDFAGYTGAPHAISCSSCTAAMHLLYFNWGFGEGDEVIVPAQTHTATAHAVELCGAKPVFVDAEKDTANIDISQIEAAITDKTRAIAIVHFLGMPVDMDGIMTIANKHNLKVVEDCALAIGTTYKGKHAGLFGDAGCFSFYPVKHITTAEGGMIICKDDDMAAKLERKKAFGVDRHMGERKIPGVYDVNMLGLNYRMNEIQAAIGIEQIKKIPGILKKRETNFNRLNKGLSEISELELLNSTGGDYVSSYYCLSIILKDNIAEKRFEIVEALKKRGVGTSVYYPKPVPHMTYYKEKYGYAEDTFPNAARISYKSIALPCAPHLNEDDMDYIVTSVKESINEVK